MTMLMENEKKYTLNEHSFLSSWQIFRVFMVLRTKEKEHQIISTKIFLLDRIGTF